MPVRITDDLYLNWTLYMYMYMYLYVYAHRVVITDYVYMYTLIGLLLLTIVEF